MRIKCFLYSLLALILCTSFATEGKCDVVLKDWVTNTNIWSNGETLLGAIYDPSGNSVPGIAFVGNGKKLRKIGAIFAFRYGDNSLNHPPAPGAFHLRFAFYQNTQDFALDPFRLNPPSPNWFHEYALPSNTNYQNVIGHTAYGDNLYYVEVDVSSLNIQTTNGQIQVASLIIDDQESTPGIRGYQVAGRPGAVGVGSSLDWYRNENLNYGPDTLSNISAGAYAYVAAKITTDIKIANIISYAPAVAIDIDNDIVLADFINNTPTSSNGGFPFKSYQIPTGSNFATASAITTTRTVRLKNIDVVFGKMTGSSSWDWSQIQYHALVWSSRQMVSNSITSGDIANSYFPALAAPPVQYGQTAPQPNISVQPTYLFSFDLQNSNIVIPAGQTFYIGVEQITPGGQVGLLGVLESNITGPLQAIQCSPAITTSDHCRYPSSSSVSQFHNDQFAIKLTATPL